MPLNIRDRRQEANSSAHILTEDLFGTYEDGRTYLVGRKGHAISQEVAQAHGLVAAKTTPDDDTIPGPAEVGMPAVLPAESKPARPAQARKSKSLGAGTDAADEDVSEEPAA